MGSGDVVRGMGSLEAGGWRHAMQGKLEACVCSGAVSFALFALASFVAEDKMNTICKIGASRLERCR